MHRIRISVQRKKNCRKVKMGRTVPVPQIACSATRRYVEGSARRMASATNATLRAGGIRNGGDRIQRRMLDWIFVSLFHTDFYYAISYGQKAISNQRP